LIKQYNLSPAQAQALVASGQMGDVLKHYSTENLGTAVDAETGEHIMFNQRTGKEITRVGGEKPEEGTWQDGPNGKVLVSSRTGKPMGDALGLTPDQTIVTRPDGSQFVADKNDPTKPIRELAPKEKVGDKVLPSTNELAEINKGRIDRGESLMTPEELIKLKQTPATNINVGTDGSVHPKAPDGYDYVRDPATGKIKTDENGRVSYYKIEGGHPADEATALAKKDAKATEKESLAKVQATSTYLNVKAAADEALKHVDTPGVVGIGSKMMRSPSSPTSGIGGLPHDIYDSSLKTIQSNVTLASLNQMRQSSPTGAALGNVSDFEDKMLQSVIAPLNTYTSPAEARRGINRVVATLELLANDNFNGKKDPAGAEVRFREALDKRLTEMGSQTSKVKVERVK
jgi:hypothetical protein